MSRAALCSCSITSHHHLSPSPLTITSHHHLSPSPHYHPFTITSPSPFHHHLTITSHHHLTITLSPSPHHHLTLPCEGLLIPLTPPISSSPGYGGPHAAFFAVKRELIKSVPGRIVGQTWLEHTRAYIYTHLQTHMHTYTCTYTCTYTHTHVHNPPPPPST